MSTSNAGHSAITEPWLSFLRAVDDALGKPITVHCIGGFALTLLIKNARPTGDIDLISVVPHRAEVELIEIAGKGSPLATTHALHVQAVHVADPPCDYEERLINVTPGDFRKLAVRILDPYDVILTKAQRNWPRDREDARALVKGCELDRETLRMRFNEELRPYLAVTPERTALTIDLWLEEFFGESS